MTMNCNIMISKNTGNLLSSKHMYNILYRYIYLLCITTKSCLNIHRLQGRLILRKKYVNKYFRIACVRLLSNREQSCIFYDIFYLWIFIPLTLMNIPFFF